MSIDLLEQYNSYEKEKKVFYVKGYVRKSQEEADGRSISNQKLVIEDKINDLIMNDLNNEYIFQGFLEDEDCTGTDSLRPNFQILLREIASGATNMIIVTDLSRLSRNIEESIHYVQGLFVSLNVRFLSIQLPEIDSYSHPDSVYSLSVPFQSIMNENHCAETSKKIKDRFKALRNKGYFIGSFAPYGWIKDPQDKHKLLIDEYVYDVMHQAKQWLFDGLTPKEVCNNFNTQGVLTPSVYEKSKGSKHNFGTDEPARYWNTEKLRHIMLRPANIGILIQGRQEVVNYKIHTKRMTTPDKWSVKHDAIPAIFTQEEYDKLSSVLKKRRYYSNKNKKEYLFTGMLKCADCGRAVIHKNTKSGNHEYGFYLCNGHKQSKFNCTPHRINEKTLEKAVLASIQQQIELAVSFETLMDKLDSSPVIKKKSISIESNLELLEKEEGKIKNYTKSLYEDLKDGLISKNEYLEMRSDYTNKLDEIENQKKNLKNEFDRLNQPKNKENQFIKTFKKHRNIIKLDKEVLHELIEKIIIHEDNRITIKYKFADEFELLMKAMEESKLEN